MLLGLVDSIGSNLWGLLSDENFKSLTQKFRWRHEQLR